MLLLLYDFPGVECGYDHSLPLEDLRTTKNQQSGMKSSRNHNDGAENFETAALKQNDSSVEESLYSFVGTGKATTESQGVSIEMQKMISEIGSLDKRMKCIEENHTNMLHCRLHDQELALQNLEQRSVSVNQLIRTCKSKSLNCSLRKINDNSDNNTDIISEESLMSLLQFDNELRDVLQFVRDVEKEVTDLEKKLASMKREIMSGVLLVDKESTKITYYNMEMKQDILDKCEKLINAVQTFKLSSTTRNETFSLEFGKLMSEKCTALFHLIKPVEEPKIHKNFKKVDIQSFARNPLIITPFDSQSSMILDKSDQSFTLGIQKHLNDNVSHLNRRKSTSTSLSNTFSNLNVSSAVGFIPIFNQSNTNINVTDEGSPYGLSANMDMINSALMRNLNPLRDKLDSLEKGFSTLKTSNSDSAKRAFKDFVSIEYFEKELKRIDMEQKQRDIDQMMRDDELMTRYKDHDNPILYDKKEVNNNEISNFCNQQTIICKRNEIELETEVNIKEDNFIDHPLADGEIILNKISRPKLRLPSESNLRNRKNFNDQLIEIGKSVRVLSDSYKDEIGIVTFIQDSNQQSEGDSKATPCSNKEYHVKLQRQLNINKNIDEDGSTGSSPSSPLSPIRRLSTMPYSPSLIARRKDSSAGIGGGIPKESWIEIVRLKYDVTNMKTAIKSILRDKIDEIQVLELIENTSNSIDHEVLTAVENNLINLTDELEDLKHNQNKQLINLRKQLDESNNTIKLNNCELMKGDTNFNNSSSVVAAGQCLGCGRVAALQNTPITAIAHGHGLETFRAGFKMPFAHTSISNFRDLRPQVGPESNITSLSRPMSTDLASVSFDIGGSVGLVDESTVLILGSSDSYIPQYSTVRPKTTSKISMNVYIIVLPTFSLFCIPHTNDIRG